MSGDKQALTEIGKFLGSLGFTKIRQGEYGRVVNGVSQYVLVHRSKFDESLYVEAYVCIASDAQGISRFDSGQSFIGGRVSPGGVDYHDHSFSGDSQQIVSAIQTACLGVVLPWFDVFSTPGQLAAVFEERSGAPPGSALGKVHYDAPFRRVRVETFSAVFPLLLERMAGHGFTMCQNSNYICFYRKAGWIWHVVLLELISAGVFLVVRVASWLPELQVSDSWTEDASPSDFDSLLLVNGGYLGEGGVSPRPVSAINVAKIEETDDVVREVERLILSEADAFYETQKTPEDFLGSVDAAYRRSSYLQDAFETIRRKQV